MRCNRAPLTIAVLASLLCWPAVSVGQATIADPGTFVVDKAGIISAGQRNKLENLLRELEQKTTAQVKVLTVASTEGEDPFSFGQRHAEAWKLGQKGKDNGALILIPFKERKLRIHTGYGLEGALPDSWCGNVSRQAAKKYMKRGQYSDGVFQLTLAVAAKVADEYKVQLTGMPKRRAI